LGLIDLSPYVKEQSRELAADPVYPPSLYVRQRLAYAIGVPPEPAGGFGSSQSPAAEPSLIHKGSDDALGQLVEWLGEADGRFVLLLASFGIGKSFLMRQLALRLAAMPGAPVPVLIELRDLQKARTLNQLIAQHLVAGSETNLDIKKFRY